MSHAYDLIQHRLRSLTREIDDALLNSNGFDRLMITSSRRDDDIRKEQSGTSRTWHSPECRAKSERSFPEKYAQPAFNGIAPQATYSLVLSPSLHRKSESAIQSLKEATPIEVDEQLRLTLRRERLEEERSLAHLRLEREKIEKEIDAAIRERDYLADESKNIAQKEGDLNRVSKPKQLMPATDSFLKIHQSISPVRSKERFSENIFRPPPPPLSRLICKVPVMIIPSDDGPSVGAMIEVSEPKEGVPRQADVLIVPSSKGIMPLSLDGKRSHTKLVIPYGSLKGCPERLSGGGVLVGGRGRRALIHQGCMSFSTRARGKHLRMYCIWADSNGQELMCVWQFFNIAHAASLVSAVTQSRTRAVSRGRALWLFAISMLFTTPAGLNVLAGARAQIISEERERRRLIREADERRQILKEKSLQKYRSEQERSSSRPSAPTHVSALPPKGYPTRVLSPQNTSGPRTVLKKVVRLRKIKISPQSQRNATPLPTPSVRTVSPMVQPEGRPRVVQKTENNAEKADNLLQFYAQNYFDPHRMNVPPQTNYTPQF